LASVWLLLWLLLWQSLLVFREFRSPDFDCWANCRQPSALSTNHRQSVDSNRRG
jgi:hypothetical protein